MKMEKLSIQEEEVMRCVWQLGRCTIKGVVEQLPQPTPPYTTVASIIGNLKRKGYVAAQRKGNALSTSLLLRKKTINATLCRDLCAITSKIRSAIWFRSLHKKKKYRPTS